MHATLYLSLLINLGITGHYIDEDFNYWQLLLGFEVLSGHHTGEYLASKVVSILDEFDICEKLGYVTADNASNNGTMTKYLEALLGERGIEWNSLERTIHCIAHVINLCVGSFLNAIDQQLSKITLQNVIEACHAIARYIRSSHLAWESFSKCCHSLGMKPITIPLDVPTRWNSTFEMVGRLLYLKKPIRRLTQEHAPHLRIKESWWEYMEVLCAFLMPFYRCTKRFESNNTQPEIDYVFFAYNTMYDHIDDVKDAIEQKRGIGSYRIASSMGPALLELEATLKKYYEKTTFPPVYGDAMILNPRCKLSIFEDSTWSKVDADMYIDGCRHRFGQYSSVRDNSGQTSALSRKRPTPQHEDAEFVEMLQQRSMKRRINNLDRYMEIPNDINISGSLDWWRENNRTYQDVGAMARDALAVPASSSSVERIFSISGRIATWERNRLSPHTISNIMMYKGRMLLQKRAKSFEPTKSVTCDDDLPVPVSVEGIPSEWVNQWWLENVKGNKLGIVSEKVRTLFASRDV